MISGSAGRGTTTTEGEGEGEAEAEAAGTSDFTVGLTEEEESGCWGRVSEDAPVGSLVGDCAAINSVGGGLKNLFRTRLKRKIV